MNDSPRDADSTSPRVLLVGRVPAPPDLEGRVELNRVSTLAAAGDALGRAGFDAVLLDAELASAERGAIPALRDRLSGAALLLRADRDDQALPDLLERTGPACVVPAEASPALQAELVALAAERARTAAELHRRVAELERRTRELEESRGRFRDVIERNADAILVVDGEGVIRFANPMAAVLVGSSRESLVGRPFGFPVLVGETTELDLVRGGEVSVVEMRVVESEWEGSPARIASLRDVTGRKRAEEAARTLIREQAARAAAEGSARRFRFMAEASALLSLPLDYDETLSTLAGLCVRELADWVVIYGRDPHGVVQRQEVAHRDPARAEAARAFRELPISPAGQEPVLEVLRTRLAALHGESDQAARAADLVDHAPLAQELGVASFLLVPLVARNHEVGAIGFATAQPQRRFSDEEVALASDLALHAALAIDNARLYGEAQRANQAKSDLLAVISHDLRTPLNSIIGHSDLLSMGIPEPLGESTLERVGRIRAGATHLLYLIDQLLSYARLESGRDEPRFEAAVVNHVVREVAAVAEPLALERGLQLRVLMPPEPLALVTDPDRLRQVLLNLVGNAIRYTEQGEVCLELRGDADGVALEVRDTGIGIGPEHLDRIFEPFWQVDPTQRSRNGSAGLGLSVVQRVARLLGGDVAVSSTPGQGSTFTVLLPGAPSGVPNQELPER